MVGHGEAGKHDTFAFTHLRSVQCSDGQVWVSWCTYASCNSSGEGAIYSGTDFTHQTGRWHVVLYCWLAASAGSCWRHCMRKLLLASTCRQ